MVKRKSKQPIVPAEKKCISSPGTTLSGDDDWVIVKKQRITILIPPLHPSEPIATNVESCPNGVEDIPLKSTKKQLLPSRNTVEVELVAGGKADHISPHPEKSSQVLKTLLIKEVDLGKRKEPDLLIKRTPPRRDKSVEVHDTRKILKPRKRLLIGSTASTDGGVFLNQMMRAANIDKKILIAGGLNNWLSSLGLHQFVGLFNRRKVDKFQLVNLTMKKLRDMGAIAVGPRRKLLHAVDCLCQPYCFQSHHIAPKQFQ